MRSIETRTYTNAILTVIAVLLAINAFGPALRVTTDAEAQRPRLSQANEEKQNLTSNAGGDEAVASATRELAAATLEIATAIREQATAQAEAQEAIGKAIAKLASTAPAP